VFKPYIEGTREGAKEHMMRLRSCWSRLSYAT